MSSIGRKLNTIAGLWSKQGKPAPSQTLGSPSDSNGPGFGETQVETIFQTTMLKTDASKSPVFKRPLCRLMPTGPKSASTNSINSESSNDSPLVEQEDIIDLTQNVRSFSEVLARMKMIFNKENGDENLENARVAAHVCLGDILRILKTVLEKYSAIHSPEVFQAASTLITNVKTFKYDEEKINTSVLCESVDQLALAFSSRVSEYLMGDIDSTTITSASKTRSCDNLSTIAQTPDTSSLQDNAADKLAPEILTPEEIDSMLMRLEAGVDLALYRAKVWSKYAKDVIAYVDKRASLEAEHAKYLHKLAQTMRPLLKEESFLPFQSIYFTALDQDIEYANSCLSTCSVLQEHKFIEPLMARRNDHEKSRKQIKDMWHRELKKMQDAIHNLRKSRHLYIQRQIDYEKAKETVIKAETDSNQKDSSVQAANKLDRKKKLEEDAYFKAMEAEATYVLSVSEANDRQQELEKVKGEILTKVRELMYQCDQTMKAVTVGYFQLQHTLSAPAPVQFQTLCENSRLYEPGIQYMEYVKRLAASSDPLTNGVESFVFEAYVPDTKSVDQIGRKNSSPSLCSGEGLDVPNYKLSGDGRDKLSKLAWSQNQSLLTGSDDTDSISSSNRSHDTSPSASPQELPRKHVIASSGDELDIEDNIIYSTLHTFRSVAMSKAAVTHKFRKLKTPAKCRECENYLYFQGAECEECGLACHKKCLETLAIQCGHRRLPRKMTTFGVEFNQHLQDTGSGIPPLIIKCISELENRGMEIKGLYRVSGVKSKVEKLCQSFENGAELVDIGDVHPNVIANVLKLYLRQLPEPLLTFALYPEFIRISKDYPNMPPSHNKPDVRSNIDETQMKCIQELRSIVGKLPRTNYETTKVLMVHLKNLSEHESENHMSASNLGIVFGPTLLRSSETEASLTLLMDTIHQTRAVELLITYTQEIFGFGECQKSDGNISELNKSISEADGNKSVVSDEFEDSVQLRLKTPGLQSPENIRDLSINSATFYVGSEPSKKGEILQNLEAGNQRTSQTFTISLPGLASPVKSPDEETKSISSDEINILSDTSPVGLISDDELVSSFFPEDSKFSESVSIQHLPKQGLNTTIITADQLLKRTTLNTNVDVIDAKTESGVTVIINTKEGTAKVADSTEQKSKPLSHIRSFSSDFSKLNIDNKTTISSEVTIPLRNKADLAVSFKHNAPNSQSTVESKKRPSSGTIYFSTSSTETPEAPLRRRSGSLDNKHKQPGADKNVSSQESSSISLAINVCPPITSSEEKPIVQTGTTSKHLPVIKPSLLMDSKIQALPSRPNLTLTTIKSHSQKKIGHTRSESLGNPTLEPSNNVEKSLNKDSNISESNLSKLSSNRQPRFV